MDLRKAAAGTAVALLGGALLAGCGDTASSDGDDGSTMEPTMESTMEPTA